jgi:hypothetical protein
MGQVVNSFYCDIGLVICRFKFAARLAGICGASRPPVDQYRPHSAGRSSACSPFAHRCRSLAFCLLCLELENVARLARERLADRVERGEADRARLAGLEDREVGQRHSDPVRELGQSHPPIVEQVIEFDGDSHLSHRPFEVFAHERAFREHAGQQESEQYGEPAVD